MPPMFKSFTTKFRIIRSGPPFQRILKKSLSIVFKRFPGVFGKAKNKCINFANARDFITVTLPKKRRITSRPLFYNIFYFILHTICIHVPNIKNFCCKNDS